MLRIERELSPGSRRDISPPRLPAADPPEHPAAGNGIVISFRRGQSDMQRESRRLVQLSITLIICLSLSSAFCPNLCSGNGDCDKFNRCVCREGFEGPDCSLRSCPWGSAWSDHANGIDQAHSSALCSNRGLCDHNRGKCVCYPGFTGKSP